MKQQIEAILQEYVEVYNFISVSEYKNHRSALDKSDGFSDYHYLEAYKTIITLAIPYPSKLVKWSGKGYGILSRYSYNVDYHLVFQRILDQITTKLSELNIQSKASVDISGVDERFAGYLSTMGFLGKNQYLIIPQYGTYSFLATILIDQDITSNIQPLDDCGTCRKCIDACPSGALDNGFEQDKCISHLSQEKIPFSDEEISYFKTMIYGCDICQRVCPKNGALDIHKYPEFEPSGIENINLKELLSMSNREYMKVYQNNASSWRGASIIKRNALCLIANQRLISYLPDIRKSMVILEDNLWYNETAKRVIAILEGL
ncbi:epoxyqueuosine reductase [Candidatus Xianfuyuplasma coldseepsis]|uniref:Epoxyqueuosine reductase n=1 Tax=Candidatus Xianfuyuplasma coldseepsis TaxID=2782163 RepID=A0A7L7KSK7_9MOLU|nr:QueG-associated DUF1730 domain-containing protein [Xianfuyuplasma coldseepsis]QMS85697.1 epoxyqueuosine reductase [Xianfuyuplasma coldseepsis]